MRAPRAQARAKQRARERARKSQRGPESKLEILGESQRGSERAGESQRERETARESKREPERTEDSIGASCLQGCRQQCNSKRLPLKRFALRLVTWPIQTSCGPSSQQRINFQDSAQAGDAWTAGPRMIVAVAKPCQPANSLGGKASVVTVHFH